MSEVAGLPSPHSPVCLNAEVEASQSIAAKRVCPALQHNAGRTIVLNDVLHNRTEEKGVAWGKGRKEQQVERELQTNIHTYIIPGICAHDKHNRNKKTFIPVYSILAGQITRYIVKTITC